LSGNEPVIVDESAVVSDSSFIGNRFFTYGDTVVTGLSSFVSSDGSFDLVIGRRRVSIYVDPDGSFSMTGPASCAAPTNTYCASISGNVGEMAIENLGSLTLERVAVIDNDVESAIVVGDTTVLGSADATLRNVLITDRPDASIRAIRLMQLTDSVTLENVTIDAFQRGLVGMGTWDISNTITNDPNDFGGTVSGDCNLSTDGSLPGSVAGNPDPQFEPGTRSRYELAATSPAIDVCTAGPSTDIDGNPRPAGNRFDIGAYEEPGEPDITPPTLTVDTPPSGSPLTVTGTVSDDGTGVDRIDVFGIDLGAAGVDPGLRWWSGTTWTPTFTLLKATLGPGDTWSFDWDPANGGTGSYVLGVFAYDKAGNFTQRNPIVYSNLTRPDTTLDSIDDDRTTVVLSGSASDDVAVRKTRLIIRHNQTGEYWNGTTWTSNTADPAVLLTATLDQPLTDDPMWTYTFTPNRTGDFIGLAWAQNGSYLYDAEAANIAFSR
jgi:hypothetical protein